MSDVVIAQIVTAVIALIGTIFSGWLTYLMARLKQEQEQRGEKQAKEVADVKVSLATTTAETRGELASVKATGEKVLIHVNSATGNMLRVVSAALRSLADNTGKPTDVAAAEMAEKAYAEHQAGQAEIDGRPGTDAAKKGD